MAIVINIIVYKIQTYLQNKCKCKITQIISFIFLICILSLQNICNFKHFICTDYFILFRDHLMMDGRNMLICLWIYLTFCQQFIGKITYHHWLAIYCKYLWEMLVSGGLIISFWLFEKFKACLCFYWFQHLMISKIIKNISIQILQVNCRVEIIKNTYSNTIEMS